MQNNLAFQLSKLGQYVVSKEGTKKEDFKVLVKFEDLERAVSETIAKKNVYKRDKIKDKGPESVDNFQMASNETVNDPIPEMRPISETNNLPPNDREMFGFNPNENAKNRGCGQSSEDLKAIVTLPSLLSHSFTSPVKSSMMSPGQLFNINFVWDDKISEVNQKVFKNLEFRRNQREIINAVLSNRDVFVIMPTGGGKSLTFQLPAYLSQGVTLVIMPLISLIYDQLKKLNDLGICARDLNSNQQVSEQNDIYDDIIRNDTVKLLFITPEKLSQSDKLNNFLSVLERKGKLNRIVIDEAHCVSQWGRDFRKDYLKLSKFRESFPNIPISALTGTATQKVREDVVKVLKMKNPLIFQSSFNRPNLQYEVKLKNKKSLAEIATIINKRFPCDSGLIYCVTKKDCEKIAAKLVKFHINADFYHSEIDSAKKTQVQNKWMAGEIKVLVATLAFGMGIDKQQVRYVFHYSFPKSLENYYQESGRAGRDGKISSCIIFYSYSDKYKLDYLISLNPDNSGQNLNFYELQSMIGYCEDIYTCRRKQQLNYFGEQFDANDCQKTCDNCISMRTGYERDVSLIALSITELLNNNRTGINTLIQIASFLKGKTFAKRDLTYLPGFGLYKDEKTEDLERVLRKMVTLDILREKSVTLFKKTHMTKIELGPNLSKFLSGQLKVFVMSEMKKKTAEPIPTSDLSSNFDYNSFFPDLEYIDSSLVNTNNLENESMAEQVSDKILNDADSSTSSQSIKLTENFLTNLSKYGKSGCKELYEEIYSRLSLVRNKISRVEKKDPDRILSDKDLEQLSKDLPKCAEVHTDFLKEIEYFKASNQIKDPFGFDFDIENIDFDSLTVKRKLPPPCSNKKLKL
jgi:RecQ family ATP-dependent DNA helicase